VEKLLTLLSTSTSDLNVRDNEEITVSTTTPYFSTFADKSIEIIPLNSCHSTEAYRTYWEVLSKKRYC
jgi:hypothetical protein